MKNRELALKTLDYIREHPETWDQGDYVCGAKACFFGRAALLAGWSRWETPERFWSTPIRELLGWTAEEAASVCYLQTDDFSELEAAVKRVLAS